MTKPKKYVTIEAHVIRVQMPVGLTPAESSWGVSSTPSSVDQCSGV